MTQPQAQPDRFLPWIRQLTLMDDRFMEVCLHENTECAELMLHIILERTDFRVTAATVQKTLPNLYGHGVRFDILAADEAGRLYDIEMQLGGPLAELARRARAYSSFLDLHLLKSGEDYKLLREHWVIFILDRDIFRQGRPLYRIERSVLGGGAEGGDLPFDDGAHIVFVNGALRGDDTPLARLMHDLNCPDPDAMHYEPLARVTRFHKTSDEGVRKMSGVFEAFRQEIEGEIGAQYLARGISIGEERGISIGREQGREQGRKQGMAQSRRAFARRLLADGFSCEKIADYTSLSMDEVRALANAEDEAGG